MEIRKSLAGTDKQYVVIQARVYDDGIHIQGEGASVNRGYGVAVTIPWDEVPEDLVTFVKTSLGIKQESEHTDKVAELVEKIEALLEEFKS